MKGATFCEKGNFNFSNLNKQTELLNLIIKNNVSIVFLTAKKKGRAFNHKTGHCMNTKEATFNERGHFSLTIFLAFYENLLRKRDGDQDGVLS